MCGEKEMFFMKHRKEFDHLWPLQAAAYFYSGIDETAMAQAFDLTVREFMNICRKHPELARAAKQGKLDDPVEEALLRRAIGFRQTEVVCEDIVDKSSGESTGTCKKKTVTKEVPPDVRALLFWLKNRRPERWREKNGTPLQDADLEFDEIDSAL